MRMLLLLQQQQQQQQQLVVIVNMAVCTLTLPCTSCTQACMQCQLHLSAEALLYAMVC
jgi:hypothetical protein